MNEISILIKYKMLEHYTRFVQEFYKQIVGVFKEYSRTKIKFFKCKIQYGDWHTQSMCEYTGSSKY